MDNNSLLPNFLIVGAAKAATTSIHEYLKQHPQIFMTEHKEPCFFSFADQENLKFSLIKNVNFIKTKLFQYQELFKKSDGFLIRGESSTPYLYFHEQTIDNIKKYVPNYKDMKIVISLRNPIERAYSQYMMGVRDLLEDKPFYEALKSEADRKKSNAYFDFFYLDRGLYYHQVKAYLENFDHVKIIFYEDFQSHTDSTLKTLLSFLEVDEITFKPLIKQNISGVSKSKTITKLIKQDYVFKKLIKPLIPKEKRKLIKNRIMSNNVVRENRMDDKSLSYLKAFYKQDIMNLEELLNKDLSHWYH